MAGKADDMSDSQEDFSGYRILAVDDNEIGLDIVAETIRELGAECETASNGKKALEMLLSSPRGYYSLVLTDIYMPEMDGIQLVSGFRASPHPDAALMPFIGMSADGNPELFDQAAEAGMNGMTNKPVSRRALHSYFNLLIKEGSANAAFAARVRNRIGELARERVEHGDGIELPKTPVDRKKSILGRMIVFGSAAIIVLVCAWSVFSLHRSIRILDMLQNRYTALEASSLAIAEHSFNLRFSADVMTKCALGFVTGGNLSFAEDFFKLVARDDMSRAATDISNLDDDPHIVEKFDRIRELSAGEVQVAIHAMALAAVGMEEDKLPPAIRGYKLTSEEKGMSLEDRRRVASAMLVSDEYVLSMNEFKRIVREIMDRMLFVNSATNASVCDGIGKCHRHLLVGTILLGALLLVVVTLLVRLAYMGNVTRELQMLERVKKERDSAIQAERAKTYFFATVSHDIRTPLNSIIGFSELLKFGKATDSERDRYLSAIVTSGHHLMALINDVLDLSKLDADKLTFSPVPSDVAKICDEVRMSFLQQAEQKGIELEIDAHGAEAAVLPVIDPARFKQIAINLVSNAVKVTDKGGVYVTVSTDEAAGTLSFRVRDTGPGIPAHNIKKVTQPFVQLSTLDRTKGTGLGLAITQRLCDKMGGKLIIESEVEIGSTFSVVLEHVAFAQAPKKEEQPKAVPTEPADQETMSAEELARRASLRVLLVDDQPLNLMVLSRLLKHIKIEHSKSVNSGAAAVEELQKEHYDLVLTDLWMPEMSGEELVNYIRANDALSSIPVFAVTADAEVVKHHADVGFNGYMLKPVTIAELDHLIASL